MAEDDATQLDEELRAIEAIFGEDCEVVHDERRVRVWVPARDATPQVQLRLLFPSEGYPSRQGPVIELEAKHLSDDMHANMVQELEDLYLPGEVCIAYMQCVLPAANVYYNNEQHAQTPHAACMTVQVRVAWHQVAPMQFACRLLHSTW